MNRRDSFITHRAFCDALAEETARLSAASSMANLQSLTNMNYSLMGTSLPLGHNNNMAQHFSSILKPVSSSHDTLNQTRQELSLWLDQTSHETMTNNNAVQTIHDHHLGSLNAGTMYSGSSLVLPCTSNPPPSDYHQMNWVFGSKISSNNNSQEITSVTTSSLPLNSNIVKETGIQLQSVPSLYSTQNQTHHQTPSPGMSATALLQKAAQFGATSSADQSSFLGNFGLKCHNNINIPLQEENKSFALYGHSENDNHSSTLSQLQMYHQPAAKRQKTHQNEDSVVAGGQTRDFLGVGVQTICHPSSIHGWI